MPDQARPPGRFAFLASILVFALAVARLIAGAAPLLPVEPQPAAAHADFDPNADPAPDHADRMLRARLLRARSWAPPVDALRSAAPP